MIRCAVLLLALAACGRIGFDPLAGDNGDSGAIDVPTDQTMAGYPGPFDSLVVWYRMDDAPANGAHDDTGQGRDGAAAGTAMPTLVAGRIGMAFDFPDLSYLRSPYLAAFDLPTFTIAYWVRPTQIEWSGVSKAVGTASANSYELGTNPMGELQICTAVIPSTGMCIATATTVSIGVWTHVAVTWTGTMLTLYAGGTPLGAFGKTGLVYDAHDLLVAAEESSGTVGFYAVATFDDVRLYSRALTDPEIAGLAAP